MHNGGLPVVTEERRRHYVDSHLPVLLRRLLDPYLSTKYNPPLNEEAKTKIYILKFLHNLHVKMTVCVGKVCKNVDETLQMR